MQRLRPDQAKARLPAFGLRPFGDDADDADGERQELPIADERASVPNPKFALLCSTFSANFGFDKDTSKLMIPVSFMVQKFARWTRGEDGANF